MIWIDKNVGINEVFVKVREELYTLSDHSLVEVLHYILQSFCRVSKVLVTKVWGRTK